MIGADGVLAIAVWPTFVGLGSSSPTTGQVDEPDDHPNYSRGQITWAGNPPTGTARVFAPAGAYDHLIYCTGPTGVLSIHSRWRFPHPLIFEEDRWLDVTDIGNQNEAGNLV